MHVVLESDTTLVDPLVTMVTEGTNDPPYTGAAGIFVIDGAAGDALARDAGVVTPTRSKSAIPAST